MSTPSEPPGGPRHWVSTDDALGWTHRLPARQEFPALDGWFYPHQAVAVTVDRELRTVRSWEAKGWLPRSPLHQPGITDPATLPHGIEDLRGRRYAYTAPMLTDLRTIAHHFGVLDGPVDLDGTNFAAQVRAAWGIPEPEPEAIVARPPTPTSSPTGTAPATSSTSAAPGATTTPAGPSATGSSQSHTTSSRPKVGQGRARAASTVAVVPAVMLMGVAPS